MKPTEKQCNNLFKLLKKRRNPEHHLQSEFFYWCKLMSTQKGFEPLKLIFAIPNGGHRNIIVASKLKAEGVKAGVPDIFFPFVADLGESGVFYGLFLEAKSEKGRLSDQQKWWRDELINAGYAFAEFRTLDEARAIIVNYLNGTLKIKENSCRETIKGSSLSENPS